MLHCIGYRSDAIPSFQAETLENILSVAIKVNAERNVTGLLCFNNGKFLQFLEGEAEVVVQLYDKIKLDKRHTNVRTIFNNAINDRAFPDWSMALRRVSDLPSDMQSHCYSLMGIGLNATTPVAPKYFEEVETLLAGFRRTVQCW